MCFALFVGTAQPLPRKVWDRTAPDLSVRSLLPNEFVIRQRFSLPEVHYVGSESGCGCDFPHVTMQNGGWPAFQADDDPEWRASLIRNREGLHMFLQQTCESFVELYSTWHDDNQFAQPPMKREEIALTEILDPEFRFKERVFYRAAL